MNMTSSACLVTFTAPLLYNNNSAEVDAFIRMHIGRYAVLPLFPHQLISDSSCYEIRYTLVDYTRMLVLVCQL